MGGVGYDLEEYHHTFGDRPDVKGAPNGSPIPSAEMRLAGMQTAVFDSSTRR